ncbi:helix-turn-helix domain-containing protein [Tenuibacillus multivorans]|uniref:Uncharacterized protein YpbB n=1 Tax=Tenuibacillus multivorans TaxID=237069 RepID=A0A1H0CX56_9BACI|nr:helix-turn-helix domain-containing protein [Tenuibacillus multivorans]GEL76130.1 hypothetical protein TMU01_03650 [Tenuibacillus multivorans]SDN62482.1 Uncharacterized protein YpbB [Tenuibacillus multivorans]
MIHYQDVISHMLYKLNGERTISSAFHILRGKRSSQTLQDIHLFGLQPYYGIYPKLRSATYHRWIDSFVSQNLIIIRDESFECTGKIHFQTGNLRDKINGFKYHRVDLDWFSAIQLVCQTLSNIHKQNKHFIPVIDDVEIQYQVKQLMKKYRHHDQLVHLFHNELKSVLEQIGELEAELMVQQFTGANRIGLSKKQLADDYQVYEEDIHLTTMSAIHQLIQIVEYNTEEYPILNLFISQKRHQSITDSAEKTYRFLNNGLTLKEIENIRQLRPSTIRDHVVEIATQLEHFDIDSFVSKDIEEKIIRVIEKVETRRLKVIKEQLDDHISYFQIRLVLAKYNHSKVSVMANG